MRMTHNFCTILHLLVFPVSTEALKSFRKADADEGHMLVLQNRQSVGQTCTATCRNNSMTCDFKGIEDIPQQNFDKMLKQLLSGYNCSGNSPLSNSTKYKFHNSTNEPSFNFGNQCASRYKDIGGKGVFPLCDSVLSNPNVGRICRCKFKGWRPPTSSAENIPTAKVADTSRAGGDLDVDATEPSKEDLDKWLVPVVITVVLATVLILVILVATVVILRRRRRRSKKSASVAARSQKPTETNTKKASEKSGDKTNCSKTP